MDTGYARLYRWGLEAAEIHPCDKVLDVGCGGDRAITRTLARARREVVGIDHFPEAVGATRRLNRSTITPGRLRVLEGSMNHLLFRDGLFNVAAAFKTTYFQPDPWTGLVEIHRVLNPRDRLVITNEFAGREAARRWAEYLDMNVPGGRSLAALAHKTGFLAIGISIHPQYGWFRPLTTGQERRQSNGVFSRDHARSGAAPGRPA